VEGARPVLESDVPDIARLWRAALSELDGQRGGALLADSLTRPGPLEPTISRMLADPDRLLVVGTLDEVAVAFGSCFLDHQRPRRIGVVEMLYVDPAARQVGVGEAMLDSLVRWCEQHGCAGMDAPALPGSRQSKAFFEGHGFVARLLVMHHPLGSSSSSSG